MTARKKNRGLPQRANEFGAPDDYFELVRTFPLRPIRNAAEYQAAGVVLNRLLGRASGKLTPGERDYVDALVLLAKDYDRKHSRAVPSKLTPAAALRYAAQQAGMGPTALGKILGTTHAMASLMLNGKRGISAQAARTLAGHFKVDAGLFI